MDSISSWLIITTGTCINQLAICWHSCDGLVQISTEFFFSVQKYFSIWEQSTIVLHAKTWYRVSICSLTLLGKTDSTHLFIYGSLTISFPYTMVGLHSLLCSILFFSFILHPKPGFSSFTSSPFRPFFHFPSALLPSTFSLFLFMKGKASHVSQQSMAYQVEAVPSCSRCAKAGQGIPPWAMGSPKHAQELGTGPDSTVRSFTSRSSYTIVTNV